MSSETVTHTTVFINHVLPPFLDDRCKQLGVVVRSTEPTEVQGALYGVPVIARWYVFDTSSYLPISGHTEVRWNVLLVHTVLYWYTGPPQ